MSVFESILLLILALAFGRYAGAPSRARSGMPAAPELDQEAPIPPPPQPSRATPARGPSMRSTRDAYEQHERTCMPREIAQGRLVTSEKTYRRRGPRALVAKVDQGFRTPAGLFVLVETKNRMWVTAGDLVQLSAQAVAVRSHVGDRYGRVADYGYLRLQLAGGPPTYLRYQLYPEAVIDRLVDRYHALRQRRDYPVARPHPSRCGGCAFRAPCTAARASAKAASRPNVDAGERENTQPA